MGELADPDKVKALAQSIAEIGLQEPVGEALTLKAVHHRFFTSRPLADGLCVLVLSMIIGCTD